MGHLNSKLLWHKYATSYFNEASTILEIGPAGYPTIYEATTKVLNATCQYDVLDVRPNFIQGADKNPNFLLANNPLHYPIADETYDIVFSDQVLAHVEQFWLWYQELKRITKKGGYIITINSYSYPCCPSPIDAWRVHADGMKILNQVNDLETIVCITESAELNAFGIPHKTGFYYPGASVSDPFNSGTRTNLWINKIKNIGNKLLAPIPKVRGLLMNPVNVAFDTITVARK